MPPDGTASPGEAPLTTTSLESIQTIEQHKLLDLVNPLHRAGLSSTLQLPQIASSGKSSVLEAITGIPFPRKENLCTRFATEIIMRRDTVDAMFCKINPDRSRGEQQQADLRKFSKSIQDFGELLSLIEEATVVMGLDEHNAFSKDVLSNEICGYSSNDFRLTSKSQSPLQRGTTKNKEYISPGIFNKEFEKNFEQKMDRYSAGQALDALNAYYKVIERHLVTPLSEVLSPKVLARYSDQDIQDLAPEQPEVIQKRDDLNSKVKMLQESQEAFCIALGRDM
ncbi:dynamin family protein [Penicillium waksmanii]|uniref:dynamin family protein n=1 Tax=Penicillium waksmanii TaxID=69791 RepID=UPI002548458E|nr:dynamin family protein [Penicillium waksmanii]KAJ5973304.1 dynamin family protein [Penicillium waksmanii]